MKLDQEKRFYEIDEKTHATLRILYPSEPRGGWPGTTRTIHVWEMCDRFSSPLYRKCTESEVIILERLARIWYFQPKFIEHSTLGTVAVHPYWT